MNSYKLISESSKSAFESECIRLQNQGYQAAGKIGVSSLEVFLGGDTIDVMLYSQYWVKENNKNIVEELDDFLTEIEPKPKTKLRGSLSRLSANYHEDKNTDFNEDQETENIDGKFQNATDYLSGPNNTWISYSLGESKSVPVPAPVRNVETIRVDDFEEEIIRA